MYVHIHITYNLADIHVYVYVYLGRHIRAYLCIQVHSHIRNINMHAELITIPSTEINDCRNRLEAFQNDGLSIKNFFISPLSSVMSFTSR